MKARRVNQRWTAEERPVIGRFLRHYHDTLCRTIDRIKPVISSDPTGSMRATCEYYVHARKYVEFLAWQVGIRLKDSEPCQVDSRDMCG